MVGFASKDSLSGQVPGGDCVQQFNEDKSRSGETCDQSERIPDPQT